MPPPGAQSLRELCEDAIDRAGAGVAEVDPVSAARAARDSAVIILDCRRPDELAAEGRIPGCAHVVLDEIPARAERALFPRGATDDDRDTPILCYCAAGVRSLKAAAMLKELGFARCASLAGGFHAWKSAGGAVEKR